MDEEHGWVIRLRQSIGFFFMFIVLMSGGQAGVRAASRMQSGEVRKVILEGGSVDPGRPGLSLWHDYGSFALYKVTESGLVELAAEGFSREVEAANEMDFIYLDAYPFNSQTGTPSFPEPLSLEEPPGAGLHLIQFVGPVKAEWLAYVEAAGATPVHYIANYAYLVWADAETRQRLSSMVKGGDFLQYSAPYQPFFKVGSTLLARVTTLSAPEEMVQVVIQMYRHPGSAKSEDQVKQIASSQEGAWQPVLNFQTTQATIRIADIPAIASLPDVVWIGEQMERELFDEVQGQIMAGDLDASQSGPTGPGYLDWLVDHGFSQTPGDYPIVDIVDDGIGNGNLNSGDNTLHVSGLIGNPTRLAYIQNCTQETNGGSPDGHGHINASIAGGYDSRAGGAYNDASGFNLGLGINPFGRLAGTRIFGQGFDISECGNQDYDIIQASYAQGARISSNSWGCSSCAGTYDASSQAYDVGSRDALPGQDGNQQMIFVFAAGNNGPESGTVGSPGNAKNVITVGASESDRPTWTDGCLVPPSGADDAMDVIQFSSRGPAPGGRVKPDLIAPGTHIQGTASTDPNYTGISVCDPYQPDEQTVFAASSGTSHSAPAVAGAASLYYYWLNKLYALPEPSPAIIKAYLIAHPTYLTGVDANDGLPSNVQGYGMPNMSLAFDNTPRYLVDQSMVFNNSGETWTFEGGVPDSTKPARIVLAYTDQAGAVGTSPQVNDLNLRVEVGGATYQGNHFSGAWSTTGGTLDNQNNVEAIFLPVGTSGHLKVTVTAFNIAGDGVPGSGDGTDQDFALVCYNCAQLSASPTHLSMCTQNADEAVFEVTVGNIQGDSSPVTLSLSGQPPGSSVVFGTNPVSPPGTSVMTIADIEPGSQGIFPLEITGQSGDFSLAASAQLNLYNVPPGQPILQSPENEAIEQPVRPVFSWQGGSQAGTYDIEIASDPGYSEIVETGTGLSGTKYVPVSDLDSGHVYYWRVRSSNACSDGNFSETFHFTTLLLPGDCPVEQYSETIYSEDFESGGLGWSHSGTLDTWQLSKNRPLNGDQSYWAEDFGSVSDQRLVTPAIPLPDDAEILFFEFWNYQAIERNLNAAIPICFDGAILEISTTGGQNWVQVQDSQMPASPYHAVVSDSYSNPLGGSPAWCGDPQDWTKSVVALDAYAGQTIQFRFRLGTDNSVGREGWYIDDVAVKSCQEFSGAGDVAISPTQIGEGRPGGEVVYDFTITNTGSFTDSYHLSSNGGWETGLSTNTTAMLEPGQEVAVQLTVKIPTGAGDGENQVAFLKATSSSGSGAEAQSQAVTYARWWRKYFSLIARILFWDE